MDYGVQISNRKLFALAKQLGYNGLPMSFKEWLEKREKQGYTRIAYAKNNYGITHELFYLKETHEFVLI